MLKLLSATDSKCLFKKLKLLSATDSKCLFKKLRIESIEKHICSLLDKNEKATIT